MCLYVATLITWQSATCQQRFLLMQLPRLAKHELTAHEDSAKTLMLPISTAAVKFMLVESCQHQYEHTALA